MLSKCVWPRALENGPDSMMVAVEVVRLASQVTRKYPYEHAPSLAFTRVRYIEPRSHAEQLA